jgi:hypothetical protein
LEPRRKVTRKPRRPGNQTPARKAEEPFPNIAKLISWGEITVGRLRPIGCVATASDEDRCLAMLVRRKNETLTQFLARLDQAIDTACNEDIFTDEINSPS